MNFLCPYTDVLKTVSQTVLGLKNLMTLEDVAHFYEQNDINKKFLSKLAVMMYY